MMYSKYSRRVRYHKFVIRSLQKGGIPATPSGTATLLRLSPSYHFRLRPLLGGHGLQAPAASMA